MKKNLVLNYKVIGVLVAAVLLLSCAIGGTMAWLATKTSEVKNTFTTSDIDIELEETKQDFKMVPGMAIDKDPKVTVTADSEDCFLFVKIDKSTNFGSYMKYAVDTTWMAVQGENGVYYRKVKKDDTTREFSILTGGSHTGTGEYDGTYTWSGNQVLVLPSVTREDMDKIKNGSETAPTLSFTAYAVQLYKTNGTEFTVVEAWAQAKNLK